MPKAAKEMVMYSRWVPGVVKGRNGLVDLGGDLSIVTKALEEMGIPFEIRPKTAVSLKYGEFGEQHAVFADQRELLKLGIDVAAWIRGKGNGD